MVLLLGLTAGCAGTRTAYAPPFGSYTPGDAFTGMASWYGPGFHGKRTASDERFNQNDFTAAHPSLPFGTIVRVTNLRNARSVEVRINERGPFVRGRVIDVSRAAARSLHMIEEGVVPVEVTVLRPGAG